MKPKGFLDGLKKAKKEGREIVLIYDDNGKHTVNKISAFGNLEKTIISKSAISFKEALLAQCQYFDTDLIKEVYVGNKMI